MLGVFIGAIENHDFVGIGHDVVVGENVPIVVDNKARPQRGLPTDLRANTKKLVNEIVVAVAVIAIGFHKTCGLNVNHTVLVVLDHFGQNFVAEEFGTGGCTQGVK